MNKLTTRKILPGLVAAFSALWLLLPPLATVLYACAGTWDRSILPETWTLEHFASLLADPRFVPALLRSLGLCFASTAIGTLIMVPVVFWVTVWHSAWDKALGILSVLPYGLPGTVAAVGLLSLYSGGPLPIAGTPVILLASYAVAILPFLYQSVRNALLGIRARDLLDAAGLLGSTPWQAFCQVILPALMPGISSAFLLSFSVLFGEFVLANLLVGGQFETMQIYLYRRLAENGHVASAVVTVYLAVLGLVFAGFLALGRRSSSGAAAERNKS